MSLLLGIVWVEPGLILKNYLTPILMAMMTLGCLKIDLKELKKIKYDWWRYLIIIINLFFVSSFLIYLLKDYLDINIYLGLLIALALPCGISVVAFAIIFDGNPTKSLITTSTAHLLAPILTPAIVWLFAHQTIKVDILSMFYLIFKLVIIPIILAQAIKYFGFDKKLEKYIAPANTFFVAMLNWGGIAPIAGLITFKNHSFLLALLISLIITILQIIFGFAFGRDREEKITWSTINFYRNTGLATVIGLTSFGTASLVGLMAYVIVTNAILAPFQFFLGKNLTTNK